MNLKDANHDVKFAVEVAQRAGLLGQYIQKRMTEPALEKEDQSPVTVADFAIQALVGYLLQGQARPDSLVAEETTGLLQAEKGEKTLKQVVKFLSKAGLPSNSKAVCKWIDWGLGMPEGRYWTLDPVDGTKGFLRQEQFATALALIENGQVQIGVLACPNFMFPGNTLAQPGSLFLAIRGEGSWGRSLGGETVFHPLQVSVIDSPRNMRMIRSVEAGHTNTDLFAKILQRLGCRPEPILMDSQAKYGLLASGQGELMLRLISSVRLNYKERIWDHAAGSLVVEEAGGKVTDLDGKDLDFSQGSTLAKNRGVVASNGAIHNEALAIIHKLGG